MANYQAALAKVERVWTRADLPPMGDRRDPVRHPHRLPVAADAPRFSPLEDGLQYFLDLAERRDLGVDP